MKKALEFFPDDLKEEKLAKETWSWEFALAALLWFIVEIVIFIFANHTPYFLPLYLVSYVLFSLTFIVWFIIQKRRNEDLAIPSLAMIAVLIFGPFGPLGICILVITYRIMLHYAVSFETWYSNLFPQIRGYATEAFERIELGWDQYEREYYVFPFRDVFDFGSLSQKQAVLDTIAMNFKPRFISLLRDALKDKSNAIRIQAAAIAAKVDFDFEKQLKGLRIQVRKQPGEAAPLLELAQHLDQYTFSGVLDKVREGQNRQEAIDIYTQYLNLKPDDESSWMALGRLLFKSQNPEKAAQVFKKYLEIGKKPHPSAVIWYLESLFILQKFDELENQMQHYQELLFESKDIPKELKEVFPLWL